MIKTHRPKLELLSNELIQKIIGEAGMKVNTSSQRVQITAQLVEDSLSSTPPSLKMYDRDGETEYLLGGDEVHFDPGSGAVTFLDSETQQERKAITDDLIRFAHLTDCLEHLHFQSTGIISTDVSEIISDSYRLYIGLLFSKKPMVTGTFRVEGFKPMHRMLVAVRGSERNLAEKPGNIRRLPLPSSEMEQFDSTELDR